MEARHSVGNVESDSCLYSGLWNIDGLAGVEEKATPGILRHAEKEMMVGVEDGTVGGHKCQVGKCASDVKRGPKYRWDKLDPGGWIIRRPLVGLG